MNFLHPTYLSFDDASLLLKNDLLSRFHSSSFQLFKNHRAAKQSKQKKLKRKQKLKQYKKLENAEKTRETVWSSACHSCWIFDQSMFKTSISLNASFNQKLCQIPPVFAFAWLEFFRLILFLLELNLMLLIHMLRWIHIVADDKDILFSF